MSEWYEVEPSPLRNVASGTSVGCGCLGLLFLLVSAVAMLGIYIEAYEGGPGNTVVWASLGGCIGTTCIATGLAGFVGSLFMD